LTKERNIVYRLTLLWAFTEGGLGGIMHLLHIPMTGFIIGGISVIINVFIASYSKIKVRVMLGSLGLVLLCKFALSPHSPLGAYVAVSFQGLLAIIIFSLLGVKRWTIFLYAIIVMLENAIQKPLMAYLIFGDELIQGIFITVNKFFKNSQNTENFLSGLTILYFCIYALWGMIIGNWANSFLKTIESFKLDMPIINTEDKTAMERVKNNKKVILTTLTFSIIFFFLFIYFSSAKVHWTIYALKAIVWFILLAFILPYAFRLILNYFMKKNETSVNHSLSFMPQIKKNFFISFDLAQKEKGFSKIRNFIYYSIYLNVFHLSDES
jgi:hypothetical protein